MANTSDNCTPLQTLLHISSIGSYLLMQLAQCLGSGCWWQYSDVRGKKSEKPGEDWVMGSIVTCKLHVRRDGMGGTCSPHGRDGKCVENFGVKTWKEKTIWSTQEW